MNSETVVKSPLSKKQVEVLMECHERELLGLPPCTIIHPHIKGLLIRYLVSAKYTIDESGKNKMVVYITVKGKQFLDGYTKRIRSLY